MDLPSVPIIRYAPTRQAASGNWAAGMLAMAEGRNAEAEQRFRENISAGALMIHQSTWYIDAMLGANIVRASRDGMVRLYQLQGRAAEAVEYSEASDPADASELGGRQLNLDQLQARRQALAMVTDTAIVRGMRMELMSFPLSYSACGDLNEILFGVDSMTTQSFRIAKKTLVRFPSDSVMWLKLAHALERPLRHGFAKDPVPGYFLLHPFAKAVDVLTGSRRFESCVSMLS